VERALRARLSPYGDPATASPLGLPAIARRTTARDRVPPYGNQRLGTVPCVTTEPLPTGRYFLSENYLRGASASGNYLSLRFQRANSRLKSPFPFFACPELVEGCPRGYPLFSMLGKFITLEGPEGSGKSTQAKMMIRRLGDLGIEAMYTREPGGTALGEEIRNILQHNQAGEAPCERAELLLFEASRNQLVEKVIRPALEKGTWVICDRFMDSTTAYQGYGRGLPVDEVKSIHTFTINDVIPELTLLLDLNVETGFDRIAQRFLELGESADRFEQEERSFHERVRMGYLNLADEEPDRFRIVDASKDPESVAEQIWIIIQELLGQISQNN